MPSMLWLGRRWSTGSDEYVCSAMVLAVAHLILGIVAYGIWFGGDEYSTLFKVVATQPDASRGCAVVQLCPGTSQDELNLCYTPMGIATQHLWPSGFVTVSQDILKREHGFTTFVGITAFLHFLVFTLSLALLWQTNQGRALEVHKRLLVARTLTSITAMVVLAHVILAVPIVSTAWGMSRTNGQLELTLATNDVAECAAQSSPTASRALWRRIATEVADAFQRALVTNVTMSEYALEQVTAVDFDGEAWVELLLLDVRDDNSYAATAFHQCMNVTAPCVKTRNLAQMANHLERAVAKLMVGEFIALIVFLLLFVILRFDAFGRLSATIDETTYHNYWMRRLRCVFCCSLTCPALFFCCSNDDSKARRKLKRRTEQQLIDDVAWSAVAVFQNLDLTPMDITAAATSLAMHQRALRKERYAAVASLYYQAHATSARAASSTPPPQQRADGGTDNERSPSHNGGGGAGGGGRPLVDKVEAIARYDPAERAAVNASPFTLAACRSDLQVFRLFEPYVNASYGWRHLVSISTQCCAKAMRGLCKAKDLDTVEDDATINLALHRAAVIEYLGFEPTASNRATLLGENRRSAAEVDSATTSITVALPSGLLLAQFTSDVLQPAFLVTADRARGAIVIAIRGTDSFTDVLTDIVATRVRLHLRSAPGEVCYCHKGMLEGAKAVLQKLRESGVLADIASHPSLSAMPIVVTGHSLGAGCAAILGVLLREMTEADLLTAAAEPSLPEAAKSVSGDDDKSIPTPSSIASEGGAKCITGQASSDGASYPLRHRVECVLYSPPGSIYCPRLSALCVGFTVAMMVGDDIVPRLSPNNLRRLRKCLAYALAGSELTKTELVGQCCCGSAFSHTEMERASQRLPDVLYVSEAEMELILRMTKETFDEEATASMRPPWRMHLIEAMTQPGRGIRGHGGGRKPMWCAWPLHVLWQQSAALKQGTAGADESLALESRPLRDLILSRDAIADHLPLKVSEAVAACGLPRMLVDLFSSEGLTADQVKLLGGILKLFTSLSYHPDTRVEWGGGGAVAVDDDEDDLVPAAARDGASTERAHQSPPPATSPTATLHSAV